jgi:hypothetical protein
MLHSHEIGKLGSSGTGPDDARLRKKHRNAIHKLLLPHAHGRYVTMVYIQKPHPFGIDRKEKYTELIAR